MNEPLSIVMAKLEEIQAENQKRFFASLTKDSTVLLSTQDVADMLRLSYQHTYREIVSRPDFPKPVNLTGKRQKHETRRWIAGDVVKYIHSRRGN